MSDDETLSFFVPGVPKPQGSKRAIPWRSKSGKSGVSLVESCSKLKDWRGDVRRCAVDRMLGRPARGETPPEPGKGPCSLEVSFTMPRPKTHYRTGKFSGMLKPSAPISHTQKPDLDKLLRGVKDALSGVLYYDDSCVVSVRAMKRWGEQPGATITLRRAG